MCACVCVCVCLSICLSVCLYVSREVRLRDARERRHMRDSAVEPWLLDGDIKKVRPHQRCFVFIDKHLFFCHVFCPSLCVVVKRLNSSFFHILTFDCT